MKLIEITAAVVLFPLIFASFPSLAWGICATQKHCTQKSTELSRDRAIANGFMHLCERTASEHFRSDYASLFSLDEISVESLGVKGKKQLLKCSWRVGETEHTVLSITENKNQRH